MSEPAVILSDEYRLSYRDWLAFPEDNRLYEVLAGEIFLAPPPSVRHQRIARELGLRLHDHLAQGGRGELLQAPLGVKLSETDVVEPDLLVVLAEHTHRVGEQAVEGPPDLVVEILSPGTAQRDVGAKQDLYERAGVREYWIVDPSARRIEVLVLDAGRFRHAGLYQEGETLTSPLLPDLQLALAEIFSV